MMKYLKVGFYGFLISFIGTLPLSTLNVTVFNISASAGENQAIWFAIGVVLVELIVVILTLFFNEKINFDGKLSYYLLPIGAILLMYLAIYSFVNADNAEEFNVATNIFPGIKSTFLLGALLSVLNPLHIPFWMTWNRVLMTRDVLHKTKRSYAAYVSGTSSGSIIALLIFVYAGTYIFQNYDQYSMIINLGLGVLYLAFSLYLAFLLYKKHFKLKIQ